MIEIAMNTYKGLIKQLFISLKELIGFLSFLVHYQIVNFINIAIAILDFSLLLPVKLSLFQLLRQQ